MNFLTSAEAALAIKCVSAILDTRKRHVTPQMRTCYQHDKKVTASINRAEKEIPKLKALLAKLKGMQ